VAGRPLSLRRCETSIFMITMQQELLTPAGSSADTNAILVGLELKVDSSTWTIDDSLAELGRLAATAGIRVAGTMTQKLLEPDPRTWIGSGKVQELKELIASTEVGYAVFDDELTPGQQRKLESTLGDDVRVVDRTRLVLDIFSQHAHTREGKLQVELAQYQYLLPRLTGMRTGLSQQTGGSGAGPVGLRGPGETQLELDRRRARRRIVLLRRELEEMRGQRQRLRSRRSEAGPPVVALVGYTNAGKSSLLNALTGAGVLVEDKLFSTLDPTTRRLKLPGGREALVTDTVGFIRKLPHDLVAAFRATLEGIEEASLILHVVDSTHPNPEEQIAAVEEVLSGLDVAAVPRLLVWNKTDLLPDHLPHALLGAPRADQVAISAKKGAGMDELLARVEAILAAGLCDVRLLIPYAQYELVRMVYEQGTVAAKEDSTEGVRLRAAVPQALATRLAAYADREGDQDPEAGGA
jgi:GTPase